MTDTLLLIDVQSPWTRENPAVTARIADALPALRREMNVLWVYLDKELAAEYPSSVSRRHLPASFNHAASLATPRHDERIFFKEEQSAFTNPALERHLLARNCKNLYLAGFMASCCVMDTGASAPEGMQVHVFENLSADSEDRFPTERRTMFIMKNIALVSARGLEKPPRLAYPSPA